MEANGETGGGAALRRISHAGGLYEASSGVVAAGPFLKGLKYAVGDHNAIERGGFLKAFEKHLAVDEERDQCLDVRELHQALGRSFHSKEDVVVLRSEDIDVQFHVAAAP